MKNKVYDVRYTNLKGELVTTTISSRQSVRKLINGEAKNSTIDTRIFNTMPFSWHQLIGEHNSKLNKTK